MNIVINQNVINRLRAEGFYPDTMLTVAFVLDRLAVNDLAVLDVLDDYTTSKRMILLYMEMARKGLVHDSGNPALYRLTEQGKDFYNELLGAANTMMAANDPSEWIKDWVELFPKGVKSGGKLLRSDMKSCLTKMKKFIKDYPEYDKDTIFKATKRYLHQQEQKNWEFTRCAIYFVHKKDEGSDLAAWCDTVKNGGDTKQERTQQHITAVNTGLV